MRRLFVLLCFSVALLFLVSACEYKDVDAVQFGKEFINELYSVDDPNVDVSKMSTEQLIEAQKEFSTYFTEKEFKDLTTKRLFLIPLEIASIQNSKISVQDIVIKEDRDQEKDDSLYFDHSFTLMFTDRDGKKIDEVEVKGQLTIVDRCDGLKIDRYYN